ncbi:MAG: hypothetical protein ABW352_14445 [Polyangiales bacterium]
MHRYCWLALLVFGVACGSTNKSSAGGEPAEPAEPRSDAGRVTRDSGTGRDAGRPDSPDFASCSDTRTEAMRAGRGSNIVWAIDTSGSMDEEAALVQQNLNRFAQAISAAGLEDYRVVVVSERSFVSVPEPLGSDPVHFLHIEEEVGSEEPLSDLLARHADYADFLLPGVLTHFVSVTDDESEIAAQAFLDQMDARLGGAFRVHAIASPPGEMPPPMPSTWPWEDDDDDDNGCQGSYGAAAAPGVEHFRAAELSDGLTFSICTQDWSGLFTELAREVESSAALSCALALPPAPAGMDLDFAKVSVLYTPESGAAQSLPQVADARACADRDGWHYDDAKAPTRIVLCPDACTRTEAGGALEVALGCVTVVQ